MCQYVHFSVHFSEVLFDLVIIVFIEENYLTHPLISLLIILVAACECVIALFVWQEVNKYNYEN